MIEQIMISALSLTSVGLAYWPRRDLRVFGAMAGLASQPLWVYMILKNGMHGLLPLAPMYTAMYLVALRAHWMKAKTNASA